MSTLSQDLDFFDVSVFDPLAEFTKKTSSETSANSKRESFPEEIGTKAADEDDDDDDDDDEEDEDEDAGGKQFSTEQEALKEGQQEDEEEEKDDGKRCRGHGDGTNLEAENGEKDDKCGSDRFSTGLWSGRESVTSRSLDSWDLPAGAVPWDDSERPIERLLSYADLTLTKEEENGLLTDRIVAACSSYLTESPENKCHVVAKVSLSNKNLNDIRILGYHRFLQYVDLSWNNLTDLTPLGCIPYLMYLDVSHNLMEEVLRFKPPLNLTYVNYSYNEIWQIDDLTDFWALCYLDLSHNKISKIQGLDNLRYLRHLDLSHNKIERLENLNDLRITDLNLEYNLISTFESNQNSEMKRMPYLTNLYLNNNLIGNLEFLKNVYHLKKLELQGNNVSDLVQLTHMKHLKNLRDLDMSGNPVCEQKPYRSLLLNFLQELRFLDQTEVDISERVAACKKHRFEVQLEAARNNARMILLEQLNDTSLGLDVLPVDQGSYPFVILVGPSASSKKFIISCLAEKYPEKIYLGKLHTTRKVLNGEKIFLEQTTREQFNEMTKSGKFLCVSENLGHLYGFSRDELGTAVKEHKLCLTAMDMVSALTIHGSGIRPFLVLAILQSKEEHSRRLKETYGPVLSLMGAAYMAQRQLVDTRESNIKRVEVILSDLIRAAVQKCCEGEAECSECSQAKEEVSSCTGRESIQEEKNSEVLSESEPSTTVFVRYDSQKNCPPCTPTTCGYQACKNLIPEYETSGPTSEDESQRFSSLTDGTKGETSMTSYSTNKNSPPKKIVSSFDEYSYGEDDPFADWSMPFIEWSEVNVSGLQLEEAAELLCQKYVESVMSTRDVYQNLHLDNPGLFSLCVFTDEAEKAAKTVGKFLKEVWRSTPARKPPFDVEDDRVYQAFVPRKLDQLKEMLRNDFLSSGDGNSRDLAREVAPINSPASICREMRLKGYGDSFDDTQ